MCQLFLFLMFLSVQSPDVSGRQCCRWPPNVSVCRCFDTLGQRASVVSALPCPCAPYRPVDRDRGVGRPAPGQCRGSQTAAAGGGGAGAQRVSGRRPQLAVMVVEKRWGFHLGPIMVQ